MHSEINASRFDIKEGTKIALPGDVGEYAGLVGEYAESGSRKCQNSASKMNIVDCILTRGGRAISLLMNVEC